MAKFKTSGTCASEIIFDVEDNIIYKVEFIGGCPGNAIGLSKLIEGMNVDEAITRMQGIKCGNKDTSCPDQLSLALKTLKEK